MNFIVATRQTNGTDLVRKARAHLQRSINFLSGRGVDQTMWLWLNQAVSSLCNTLHVNVDRSSDFKLSYDPYYIHTVEKYPAQAVAAVFGVGSIRAEFDINIESCQVSMRNMADLIERLALDSHTLMLDHQDLLGGCASYMLTD